MKPCKIGVMYNEPLAEGVENWESSRDVLVQVEAIEGALRELGAEPIRFPFTGELLTFVPVLAHEKPDLVFNLCESVNEDPRYIGHPAAILELMDIPFTGSPSHALMLSTDKLLSKQLLVAQNMQTSAFHVMRNSDDPLPAKIKFPVIIKPRFQDASIGIDQDSICRNKKELAGKIKMFIKQFGETLIEEYIPGDEFNISLLGPQKPTILPFAKIDFTGLPDHLMPIVSYKAKWEPDSDEYKFTARIFPDRLPVHFTKAIHAIAMNCFRTFMLRDYARIDFRVDVRGRIFVIEVNANPCLSPDAGFAAAAQQDHISYTQLIATLVDLVLNRKKEQ